MLAELNDNDLIENIKQKNEFASDSIITLASRHAKMFSKFYGQYNQTFSLTGANAFEVINKEYTIYEAANSFDYSKRVKFSTHLYNTIRFKCLNAIKPTKEHLYSVESGKLNYLKDPNLAHSPSEKEEDEEVHNIVHNYVARLNNDQTRAVLEKRYFNDGGPMKWQDIADSLKISKQTAINIHTRALKTLKYQITNKI